MERERIPCPECGLPAEVEHRTMLPSTDGPVEHVKTRCATGHWFFMEARPSAQEQPSLPSRRTTVAASAFS